MENTRPHEDNVTITKFQEQVYAITKKIPRGKVTTYKAIAETMGTKAYRAVGQALHKNPYAPQVPCHRVIASDGSLSGFATGQEKKRKMLEREGVKIKENKISKKFFFQ